MNNLKTVRLLTRVMLRLGLCILIIAFSNINVSAQTQQNAPAYGYSPPAEPVFSPHNSLVKTREFLDYITLRVLTNFNYYEVNEQEGTWKTEGLQGILESRYFLKDISTGVTRTIEISIIAHPLDGYEFYFFGNEIHGESNYINPELVNVKENISTIAQTIQSQQQESGITQTGYEFYTLSYIQSDRALALLKSIGYTITEFTQRNAESVYERIFDPQRSGEWKLPVIVKVIDAPKTSLMESSPIVTRQEGYTVVPDIGGTFLHHTTSGEPLQRLLIVYDEDDPEPMEELLNLLREKIDKPARQIVIEARVIVINTERLRDLGLSFRYIDGDYDVSFLEGSESGSSLPFTTVLNEDLYSKRIQFFRGKIESTR